MSRTILPWRCLRIAQRRKSISAKKPNPYTFYLPHGSAACGAFSTSAAVLRDATPSLDKLDPKKSGLADIDPSKLEITKTTSPKDIGDPNKLVFGKSFTDHMLTIPWDTTNGWYAPQIKPYANLSLDPATSVFHYAFCCFEGMKAFRNPHDSSISLFRPQANMARLNSSGCRIALPMFSESAMVELMARFVALEQRFIPQARGYSLYLRPTFISTQVSLGVGPPGSALLYVIASPVGPYYTTGFKAVSLQASSTAIRAWPGGVGDKKLGSNYAPCIVPQMEAARQGFQQNLWLFRDPVDGEEYISEVGTMNLFVAIKSKDGKTKELVTPPLDGTILVGITRDSVLQLARERMVPQGWKVSERQMSMREMAEASDEGRLIEAFGAGTAAVVAPVRRISWNGRMVECGLEEGVEGGDVARQMKTWIEGIHYGDEEHPWCYKIPRSIQEG